ncbi:MAG TPA: hypothetical protein VFR35_04010 [Actinoplanes sp.]|nr:hypothetical protein [Actinoplanes sp.]
MSERTYAPRSGGRTTEQRIGRPRITEARVAEPRRRPSTGTEGEVRGARRQAAPLGPAVADRDRAATTRGTGARAAAPLGPAGRSGRAAAVQGTAALKLDTAVAEPLRVSGTAAAEPRLRVAPPAPISAPRAPFIAAVIGLVVVGVIGILLINTKTNENSFEISRLQDHQAALDNQQQQLENQLAVYDSVGNLDAAAKRLGLVKADAPAYIRLPDGKVIGVPRPGTGKPAVTAQDAEDAKATQPGQTQPGQAQPGTRGQTTQGQTLQGTTQDGAAQQGAIQPGAQPGQVPQGTTQQGTTQQGQPGQGQPGQSEQGSGEQGSGEQGSGEQGSGGQGPGQVAPDTGE